MTALPKRRHYSNPPIIETILEFRFKPTGAMGIEKLRRFGESQGPRYAPKAEVFDIAGQFSMQGPQFAVVEGSAKTERRLSGFLFADGVAGQTFQIREGGFAFSKLHPYTNWESVREEARRVWEQFVTVAAPQTLSYVGLRYMNRIDLPVPVLNLKEWLTTAPSVANGIPQSLAGYTMQLILPQVDLPNTVVALTQATVRPARQGVVSILFDVDVRHTASLPVNDPSLWERIEQLHERENLVFESSITDKLRELIDQC